MQDGKHVILCIDDDPDFLMAMRVILESNGFVMVEAGSAEEGLRAFTRCEPSAVLVDLMMEEVDAGVNFVKEIKLLGSHVPVFMLSSVGDSFNDEADYNQLGLSGILQKPVSADSLVTLLNTKL